MKKNALFKANPPVDVKEEADDILTEEEVSSIKEDDFITTIEAMDIQKEQSNPRMKLIKSDLQKTQAEATTGAEEAADPRTFGHFIDPVGIYLREMGATPLLSREEEVEIAKRIEAGKQEIAYVVLQSPIIVSELISLEEHLRSGKISIREVAK